MDTTTAARWLSRWDAQQERYIADREERFRVVIDVVQAALDSADGYDGFDRPRPLVVDLGCGPGSLADRLAAAVPQVDVVGVDADPLLLALAQANARPNVRYLRADLARPEWLEQLDGPWDAVVSSTALHWLEPDRLAAVYRHAAKRLRPGGVLVNADNMRPGNALDALALRVREQRAARAGVLDNEDWQAWWTALRADEELAALIGERTEGTTIVHSAENTLSAREHAALLRDAGFAEAGPVWQSGDDHVLVGLR